MLYNANLLHNLLGNISAISQPVFIPPSEHIAKQQSDELDQEDRITKTDLSQLWVGEVKDGIYQKLAPSEWTFPIGWAASVNSAGKTIGHCLPARLSFLYFFLFMLAVGFGHINGSCQAFGQYMTGGRVRGQPTKFWANYLLVDGRGP